MEIQQNFGGSQLGRWFLVHLCSCTAKHMPLKAFAGGNIDNLLGETAERQPQLGPQTYSKVTGPMKFGRSVYTLVPEGRSWRAVLQFGSGPATATTAERSGAVASAKLTDNNIDSAIKHITHFMFIS